MNDFSANSYDLLDAREMLGALLPKQKGVLSEKKTETAPKKYVSLSPDNVARLSPVKEVSNGSSARREQENDLHLRTFDSWESIVAWSMSISKADTGFVVDSQGFVIASRGRIPSQGVEGVGAELVCSIEQLERIDPDAGKLLSVELEFDKRSLIGFVSDPSQGNCYVMGLIAPVSMSSSHKQAIIQQISHNLANLD